MKSTATLALAVLCLGSNIIAADAPGAATNAPRRNFTPPVVSPEIKQDGQVTFRLRAAKANEVALQGQWKSGRVPMTKGSNDVWSVTTGPIDPGVWEYSFNVDGIAMIDPANRWIKPQREPRTSILHINSNPPALWDFQDVPHGTVRLHTYRSKTLGRLREMEVYTPPGYDQSNKRYPLLVLQHGAGDNEAAWVAHGKAHWIIDNLIAEKKATPMVVVMLDGHASVGPGGGNNTEMFEKDLLNDVMPMIEQNYRIKKGAENRGIVGLSMGGGESLTVGLNHLDQFGWVGGFSSAVPNKDAVDKALSDPNAKKKLKALWIGCGKDDFLLKRNEDFIAYLKEKGIPCDWHQTEGNHSWPVWRNYLGMYVPTLFH